MKNVAVNASYSGRCACLITSVKLSALIDFAMRINLLPAVERACTQRRLEHKKSAECCTYLGLLALADCELFSIGR